MKYLQSWRASCVLEHTGQDPTEYLHWIGHLEGFSSRYLVSKIIGSKDSVSKFTLSHSQTPALSLSQNSSCH